MCLPLQANSVRPSRGVVYGRADGLGDGPLVPHLLPVVTPPELHVHIVAARQGNGLLWKGKDRANQLYPSYIGN